MSVAAQMADWLMAGWLLSSPPRLARGLCRLGRPVVVFRVGSYATSGCLAGGFWLLCDCWVAWQPDTRLYSWNLAVIRPLGDWAVARCAGTAVIWPTDWDICLRCDWAVVRRPGIAVIRLVGPLSPPDTAPLSPRPATASPATPQSSTTAGRSSSPPRMRSSLR